MSTTEDNLAELGDLLNNDPGLRERYDAATEGRLPAPVEVVSMADVSTSIRLPQSIVDRADGLIRALAADERIALIAGPGRVSRSTVLRLAIAEGLAVLESQYRADPEVMGTLRNADGDE